MSGRRRQASPGLVQVNGTEDVHAVLSSLLTGNGFAITASPSGDWLEARGRWPAASASAVDPACLVLADIHVPSRARCWGPRGWSVPVLFVSGDRTAAGHHAALRRCATAVFDEPAGPAGLMRSVFLLAPPWMFCGAVERVTSALTSLSSFMGVELGRLRATVLGSGRFEDGDAGAVLRDIESCGELCGAGARAVHSAAILESDLPLDVVFDSSRADGWTGLRLIFLLRQLGIRTSFALVSAFGDYDGPRRGRHLGYTVVVARTAARRAASTCGSIPARSIGAARGPDGPLT